MPPSRESPYDPLRELPRYAPRRADTDLQALMETRPHEQIQPSIESLLPIRQVLTDAFDQLVERDKWIINSILIERKSIRRTAKDISLAKSHVDRLYKKALAVLQDTLIANPIIQQYLHRSDPYDD